MKIAITLAVLAALVTLAFAGQKNITSIEAQSILSKNQKAFILDVRTPEEFRQAHLRGAVLIPLNELERRLAEVPRQRLIFVYCAVGSRSNAAAGILAAKGYREIYNLSDGIVGWYRNGFPIEK